MVKGFANRSHADQLRLAHLFARIHVRRGQDNAGKPHLLGFANPEVGLCNTAHFAAQPDLAVKYIDMHLDPKIQSQLMKPPYDVIPTSSQVTLEGEIARTLAKSHDDLAKVRGFDWDKLNPQRGALIERFNREIKV